MRVGYSWPLGHGRRAWISMGPIGWLLLIWLMLPLAAAWWALFIVLWVLHLLYVLAALAVHSMRERRRNR